MNITDIALEYERPHIHSSEFKRLGLSEKCRKIWENNSEKDVFVEKNREPFGTFEEIKVPANYQIRVVYWGCIDYLTCYCVEPIIKTTQLLTQSI